MNKLQYAKLIGCWLSDMEQMMQEIEHFREETLKQDTILNITK